jgi:hypothetical protein
VLLERGERRTAGVAKLRHMRTLAHQSVSRVFDGQLCIVRAYVRCLYEGRQLAKLFSLCAGPRMGMEAHTCSADPAGQRIVTDRGAVFPLVRVNLFRANSVLRIDRCDSRRKSTHSTQLFRDSHQPLCRCATSARLSHTFRHPSPNHKGWLRSRWGHAPSLEAPALARRVISASCMRLTRGRRGAHPPHPRGEGRLGAHALRCVSPHVWPV